MAKVEITVNGVAYPCRQTMGAMLRFKRETGKEVYEIFKDLSDEKSDKKSLPISELCTYLWCCVCSASKHDGIDFGLSLMDFADSISPEDIQAWTATLNEGAAEAAEGEKKSQPQ